MSPQAQDCLATLEAKVLALHPTYPNALKQVRSAVHGLLDPKDTADKPKEYAHADTDLAYLEALWVLVNEPQPEAPFDHQVKAASAQGACVAKSKRIHNAARRFDRTGQADDIAQEAALTLVTKMRQSGNQAAVQHQLLAGSSQLRVREETRRIRRWELVNNVRRPVPGPDAVLRAALTMPLPELPIEKYRRKVPVSDLDPQQWASQDASTGQGGGVDPPEGGDHDERKAEADQQSKDTRIFQRAVTAMTIARRSILARVFIKQGALIKNVSELLNINPVDYHEQEPMNGADRRLLSYAKRQLAEILERCHLSPERFTALLTRSSLMALVLSLAFASQAQAHGTRQELRPDPRCVVTAIENASFGLHGTKPLSLHGTKEDF